MQLRAVVKWGRRNAIKQDQDVPATGSKMPRLPRTTNKISFFSRTWKYFVDALASLDFKLSVSQSLSDSPFSSIKASASTGLSVK